MIFSENFLSVEMGPNLYIKEDIFAAVFIFSSTRSPHPSDEEIAPEISAKITSVIGPPSLKLRILRE